MATTNQCFLWVALIASAGSAADEFPYSAYVAIDGAEVVSGPGQRFYATDHLKRGTQVEIYREEASGWLAIRPTEGSFSWVPARLVELSAEDERVGRVTAATPAWIGTAVEQVSEHRQLVTLKEGELVQILGDKQVPGTGGKPEKWLKIEPPAGEFRWIHLRDVSRQQPPPEPPAEVVVGETRSSPLEATAAGFTQDEPRRLELGGPAMPLSDIEQPGSRREAAVDLAQFGRPAPAETKPISPDGFVPRKRRGSEQVQATPASPLHARSSTAQRSWPAPASAPVASEAAPVVSAEAGDQLAQKLERIELDLSLMVAQDKSLWDLGSIKARVQELVERGADPASRGRARLVLDKVEQFEQAFAVQNYGPVRKPTAATGNSPPAASALADPHYDAQGWLKPVVSRQGAKPIAPFAVVDQEGQPLCFVTPTPGVNVNRYLNKQVGVYGRRGYLEELKKPHVTAERIIDLDRQWR